MTHRIASLAAPEVASRLAAGAVALLPMGSLETHGPALPMGDYLLAEDIAERIAAAAWVQGADALVAPAIPFGGEAIRNLGRRQFGDAEAAHRRMSSAARESACTPRAMHASSGW